MSRAGIVAILFSLVLTACGGGGGGSAVNQNPTVQPVTPHVIPSTFSPGATLQGNFRLARLDYRYDTASNSFNSAGYQTTSYQAVASMVDQIKAVGFTGLYIQLEVPVNNLTGLINDDPNNIKTPPKALWQVVDYAKSIGLQVWISLEIDDSNTDVGFTPNLSLFSEDKLFNSIINFDVPIASLAEQHHVDGINIGEGSFSLEGSSHINYWINLINQIKNVYSGKLSYTTMIVADTPIFGYVDYISVFLSGGLSKTPVTDLTSIVKLFNNDIYGVDEVAQLRKLATKYNKKIILSAGYKGIDAGVNIDPTDFFTAMTTNFTVGATNYTTTNTDLKNLKVQAFLEMVGLELSDVAIGVTLKEFSPWLQDTKFTDPANPVYQYYCCSWEISVDAQEQKTINSYFSKPWNYHSINSLN